jgi:hypothetical protein
MLRVFRNLLRISPAEAKFSRRGFHTGSETARAKLEYIGETFLLGYEAALADDGLWPLSQKLDQIEPEFRGFGFEGAAMALDILDQLQPWGVRRVRQFLSGAGKQHVYMVHVGAGWSLARLRFLQNLRLSHFDPLLRWLVIDGFGFHEGYFHWGRYRDGNSLPRGIHGYGHRAFDQGLGRSLWFVAGADPEYIASAMKRFHESRRKDLWSGIGLACAYAGGVKAKDIDRLRLLAGVDESQLAQGVVFAAAARELAGNPARDTELACRRVCGFSAQEAALICADALRNAVADALRNAVDASEPTYEVWRRHVRTHFLSQKLAGRLLRSEA